MTLPSPAAAAIPAVPVATTAPAGSGGTHAATPPGDGGTQADGLVSSRLRSSDDAMLGVFEFCGVLADTSFDPACRVDEYDEFVEGSWVPRPLRLMHELRDMAVASSAQSTSVIDASHFIGTADDGDTLHDSVGDPGLVDFCLADSEVEVRRPVSSDVPVRTVRYPWGDVPYEWAAGYDNSVMFQTEVDCTADSFVYTSLEAGDDPTCAQAMKGPERQKWMDAKEDEMDALRDLGVIILTPADAVPLGEDIYDTMAPVQARSAVSSTASSSTRCAQCSAATK